MKKRLFKYIFDKKSNSIDILDSMNQSELAITVSIDDLEKLEPDSNKLYKITNIKSWDCLKNLKLSTNVLINIYSVEFIDKVDCNVLPFLIHPLTNKHIKEIVCKISDLDEIIYKYISTIDDKYSSIDYFMMLEKWTKNKRREPNNIVPEENVEELRPVENEQDVLEALGILDNVKSIPSEDQEDLRELKSYLTSYLEEKGLDVGKV